MTELLPNRTAILVVDFQERLCAAMDPRAMEVTIRNVTHLLTLAHRLQIPIIGTEQYPKGLGPTVAPIADFFADPPAAKTTFSALRDIHIADRIARSERTQWVIVGMETHICVYQTVRDLVAQGFDVLVPRDAVLSRTRDNWEVGLDLIQGAGGRISATEAVLFDVLKEANGPVFKEVSRLIR